MGISRGTRSVPAAEVERAAATGPKRRSLEKDTEAAAAAERGRRISAVGEAANLETAAAALQAMAKTLLYQPQEHARARRRIGERMTGSSFVFSVGLE